MIEESVRQRAERAKGEVHHGVPRCLLRLRDRADARPELDGEGLQRWLDYEFEALRWGVDPDVSREDLASLVEGSTVVLDRDEHRERHAGDFARWGRRGGIATLSRYGTAWFSLLAKRRWRKITAETLAEALSPGTSPLGISSISSTSDGTVNLRGTTSVLVPSPWVISHLFCPLEYLLTSHSQEISGRRSCRTGLPSTLPSMEYCAGRKTLRVSVNGKPPRLTDSSHYRSRLQGLGGVPASVFLECHGRSE